MNTKTTGRKFRRFLINAVAICTPLAVVSYFSFSVIWFVIWLPIFKFLADHLNNFLDHHSQNATGNHKINREFLVLYAVGIVPMVVMWNWGYRDLNILLWMPVSLFIIDYVNSLLARKYSSQQTTAKETELP